MWGFVFNNDTNGVVTPYAEEVCFANNEFFKGNRSVCRALHVKLTFAGIADVFGDISTNYNWARIKNFSQSCNVYIDTASELKYELINSTDKRLSGTNVGCALDVYLVYRAPDASYYAKIEDNQSVWSICGADKMRLTARAEEVDFDATMVESLT